MPSKLRVRYIFRPSVKAVAKLLTRLGLKNPNVATVIMLLFSVIACLVIVLVKNLLLFGIFVFCCGFFDGVDGAIARLNNRSSKKGGFFDSTMDRLSEFIIFIGLLSFCFNQALWGIIDMNIVLFIALISSEMISYTRARAETIYRGDYDIGLMARSERLIYLVITSIISFFFTLYFNIFLFVFMWLVLGTFIFRATHINNQIKKWAKGDKD